MLKYSYKCDSCGACCTHEYERGKAPRIQECEECGGTTRRVIKVTNSANVASEDGAVDEKSKKIRKNLKGRKEKLKKMTADEQERLNKWSKKQTGGRW